MENQALQALLEKLYGAQTLTAAESETLFNAIMLGELSNEQIAAMLVALKVRGETIDEVNGAVLAAVKNAKPFPTPDYPFADIVGTGGDHSHSINISTTASMIIAAAGVKVAKHGNRAASSKCGAADCLEALGVNLDQPPEKAIKLLEEVGLCFLFAQKYHTSMKHVGAIRKEHGL